MMPEFAPLYAERQWLCSKLLSGDSAPNHVPLGVRCLDCDIKHRALVEARNIEKQIDAALRLLA